MFPAIACCFLAARCLQGGSFFSDFNSGAPAGTAVFGNSVWSASGGYTNSGCIRLTTNANSQTGGFVITGALDSGTPVVAFTATYKALIGGGSAADGMSFNFAPDLPFGAINEEGAGTGLTVEFDTYANAAPDSVGIDIKAGGVEIATQGVPNSILRANTLVDVFVQLTPDGSVQVFYDGTYAYTNQVNTGITSTSGGFFGFGARTGGKTINISSITSRSAPTPTPSRWRRIIRRLAARSVPRRRLELF